MTDYKTMVNDPVTKAALKSTLSSLGVKNGQIIEVHCRMSSFHWLIGGARTVVDALLELESEGTLLMPEQCSDNSEPSAWVNPPISPEKYKEIRESIPPFSARYSDVRAMGSVAENFRHREGVIISNHPSTSYAAWGQYARVLCNRQSLHFPLAEESPAARLYELKGNVLLIGCDFDKATCMHLAEYRTDSRPVILNGACLETDNGPVWKKYLDLDIDSDVFMKIERSLRRKKMLKETTLGGCKIMFFNAAEAIDELSTYLQKTSIYEMYR